MKIIQSNILNIKSGIICHQVNCKHVAEARLAKQIGDKWPRWHRAYHKRSGLLGQVSYCLVDIDLSIADLYAQYDYGRDKRYTDYEALEACLKQLPKHNIYLPYMIGCGLAGGNWAVVSEMIERIIPNATIVKLK